MTLSQGRGKGNSQNEEEGRFQGGRGPPVSTAVDRQDFQEDDTVRRSKGSVFRRDSDN